LPGLFSFVAVSPFPFRNVPGQRPGHLLPQLKTLAGFDESQRLFT
jgi:hypothetical protein